MFNSICVYVRSISNLKAAKCTCPLPLSRRRAEQQAEVAGANADVRTSAEQTAARYISEFAEVTMSLCAPSAGQSSVNSVRQVISKPEVAH